MYFYNSIIILKYHNPNTHILLTTIQEIYTNSDNQKILVQQSLFNSWKEWSLIE